MKKERILEVYLNFRIYIFPAVVLISALILIIFVIYPQTVKLIQNQNVHNNLEEKTKFLEAKASSLNSLDEDELVQKVGYVLAAFPTDRDFGNIVSLLQAITKENNFNISTLSVNTSSESLGGNQKYGIKLDGIGFKSSLPRLISAIESSVRIMKVRSMEISPSAGSDIVSAILGIEVFYSPPPQTFGGPDSPLPEISQRDEELIETIATFITKPAAEEVGSFGPRGKSNPFE